MFDQHQAHDFASQKAMVLLSIVGGHVLCSVGVCSLKLQPANSVIIELHFTRLVLWKPPDIDYTMLRVTLSEWICDAQPVTKGGQTCAGVQRDAYVGRLRFDYVGSILVTGWITLVCRDQVLVKFSLTWCMRTAENRKVSSVTSSLSRHIYTSRFQRNVQNDSLRDWALRANRSWKPQ